MQAAVLNVKLTHLSLWTEQRRAHAKYYDKHLADDVRTPVGASQAKHVYYMYEIMTQHRDALQSYLQKQGIHTGIHYPIPLHLQPAYQNLGYQKGSFPVSEQLAKHILSIPLYPELTKEQQDYVIDHIKKFHRQYD